MGVLPGIIAAVVVGFFAVFILVRMMMKNDNEIKNGIQTTGTVTDVFPTGVVRGGTQQVSIGLKYEIDGISYHGHAFIFTHRMFYMGVVVPIMVNPKDLLACSIL